MTISNDTTRNEHTGNGSSTVFAYQFRIIDPSDLLVVLQTSDGTQTEQALGVHYSVQGVGEAEGGSVTMVTPPPSGSTLSVILDPTISQGLDLTAGGPLPAEGLENALDAIVNQVKRTRDLADRGLTLRDGDPSGTGSFDAMGALITGLADPVLDSDAATRQWVAAQIANALLDGELTVSSFMAGMLNDADATEARTTLGATALGDSLFTSASGTLALAALGVPNWATLFLFSALSQDAARSYLAVAQQVPLSNLVVNADFQVWQFGATISTPADNAYFADQWKVLSDGAGVVSAFRVGNAFPPDGRGAAFLSTQTANTKFGAWTVIENQKTRAIAGKKASLSIAVKGSGDLTGLRLIVAQWTGLGDIITTSDPIAAWNGATTSPGFGTNWAAIAGADVTITASTDWQTFKIEDIDIPASATNLAVLICTNDASYAGGGASGVYLSAVQLVESDVAVRFRSRSLSEEIRECERFYAKTFDVETAPAQNAGLEGAISINGQDEGAGQGSAAYYWRFPTRMVKAPTITTYNPIAANASWSIADRGDLLNEDDTEAAIVENVSKRGVGIGANNSGNGNSTLSIHAVADARL